MPTRWRLEADGPLWDKAHLTASASMIVFPKDLMVPFLMSAAVGDRRLGFTGDAMLECSFHAVRPRRALAIMATGVLPTVMVLFSPGLADAAGDGTFAGGSSGLRSAPVSVAVGDLTGSGAASLVFAEGPDDYDPRGHLEVFINFNDGNGFGGDSYEHAGAIPSSVAIGPVGGDESPYFVAANSGDDTVSVFRGNDSQGRTYGVGSTPKSVVIGDLNGDGLADVVTADAGDDTVSVLLARPDAGGGGFEPRAVYDVGSTPESVVIGDLNGDGLPDLATADAGDDTVSVLYARPASAGVGYQPATAYPVGSRPASVAVGDVNRDGLLDLVTADAGADTVSVLRARRATAGGGFATLAQYRVGRSPRSVAVADLNGDGRSDIVTADHDDNTVSVLLASGNGGFAARSTDAVGAGPVSVGIGDLNGDGVLDVVSANSDDQSTTLLYGNPGTTTVTCNGKVATIVGTDAGETLTGTTGDDVIAGLAGNDTINGLGGNDTICGGKGKDFLNGGDGADTLLGEDGGDRLRGDAGNDNIDGGAGNDVIDGGADTDTLISSSGNDKVRNVEHTQS